MNRRLLIVAVVAVLLVSFAVVGSVRPTQAATTITATVRAFHLNVRTGPGVRNARVALLKFGDIVTVMGRNSQGTWLKVQTRTGLVDWVSAPWVRLSMGSIMNLPIVQVQAH